MDAIKNTNLKETYKAHSTKIHVGAASLVVAAAAVIALTSSTPSQAVSDYRNCSDDAIIRCGAISQNELLEKYDQNAGDIQNIYAHYGITRNDIAGKNGQVKSGTVYQDGRVVVDGKTVATNAYSLSRKAFNDQAGNGPKNVKINGTTYYEGPNMSIFVRSVDAYVIFHGGNFYRAIISSCANPVMAAPVEQPKPAYTCDSLKQRKVKRTQFEFTSAATAINGAEIVNYTYDFGDGTKDTTGKVTVHNYTNPGTYKVTVTVNVKVNDDMKTSTGVNCQTTVTVEAAPVTPIYTCDMLTTQPIQSKDRTYAYTLAYTAEGGATLTKVTYNFGDNTSKTFDAKDATNVEHTYANPGNYTTTTTLYFAVKEGDKTSEKSIACSVAIVVPKPENCIYPGKETLPKNSPECVETPTELPHTGLGAWIGGGVGLAAIAGAGYYYLASHKNLRDKLLRR